MVRGRDGVATVGLGAGTVLMIAGTFAPWLRSGEVSRNSYRTAGLLQRLLDVNGAAGTALDAMPLFALFCALGWVAFILGWRRSSAAVLAVLAVAMGALAGAAISAPTSGEVQVALTGPILTLVGSVTTILAAIGSVLAIRADKRSSTLLTKRPEPVDDQP